MTPHVAFGNLTEPLESSIFYSYPSFKPGCCLRICNFGIVADNDGTAGFYVIESNILTALTVTPEHFITEKPAPLFCFELTSEKRQFISNSHESFYTVNRLQSSLRFSLRNVETDEIYELPGKGVVFFNVKIQ